MIRFVVSARFLSYRSWQLTKNEEIVLWSLVSNAAHRRTFKSSAFNTLVTETVWHVALVILQPVTPTLSQAQIKVWQLGQKSVVCVQLHLSMCVLLCAYIECVFVFRYLCYVYVWSEVQLTDFQVPSLPLLNQNMNIVEASKWRSYYAGMNHIIMIQHALPIHLNVD